MEKLPEELLHAIVETLAHNNSFIESQLLEYREKYASSGLLSFSLVSRQLRRLCVSFLFSHIAISSEDLRGFIDQCITCDSRVPMLVRTLTLVGVKTSTCKGYGSQSEQTMNSIICLLPHLTNLSQINLKDSTLELSLLTALQSHPAPSIVIDRVDSLALECLNNATLDLSKIVVKHGMEHRQDSLRLYISRGLQVKELLVVPDMSLSSVGNLHSLSHLRFFLHYPMRPSVALLCLPEFTVSHPFLQKITFYTDLTWPESGIQINTAPFPFILPFFQELSREGFCRSLCLGRFSITRRNSVPIAATSLDSNYWEVTGLYLQLYEGFTSRVLDIARVSFPKLSILTVDCCHTMDRNVYTPIDSLFTALSQFSSLQVLNLCSTLRYLDLADQIPPFDIHKRLLSQHTTPADAEAVMIWYITCMANKTPSIEAFYIKEQGVLNSLNWRIQGWIDSHMLRNNDPQDMIGILDFFPLTENPRLNAAGYRCAKHSTHNIFV